MDKGISPIKMRNKRGPSVTNADSLIYFNFKETIILS